MGFTCSADKRARFTDYDRDGDPDLFVTNSDASNRLFFNDGYGAFIDVTQEVACLLCALDRPVPASEHLADDARSGCPMRTIHAAQHLEM